MIILENYLVVLIEVEMFIFYDSVFLFLNVYLIEIYMNVCWKMYLELFIGIIFIIVLNWK